MGAYFAFLKPGDTIFGMNLAHGGHLTHGSPVNISGKYFKIIPYGVDEVHHRIDYDNLEKLAREHRPNLIVAGASAYPRIIDFERIGKIAKELGILFMVDMAHIAGLVAAGLHPSPVPHADVVTTTTHKTLRGPRGGMILCRTEHAKAIEVRRFSPGTQGGPLMHIIAAKAVALKEAMSDDFKTYQAQIIKNAKALADKLMQNGFVLVSGGTDNHLILVDVRNRNLTGKVAERLLDDIGVTVNKNSIPNDPASPMVTSGVRIGTAAVTTRGFLEKDMAEIADIITLVLDHPTDESVQDQARIRVKALCDRYPLHEK